MCMSISSWSIKASCNDLVSSVCARVTQDRERVMPLMIRGFRDAAEEGGTSVTGGQTVINPWIIIGGVASVVCQPNEFIMWVSKNCAFSNAVFFFFFPSSLVWCTFTAFFFLLIIHFYIPMWLSCRKVDSLWKQLLHHTYKCATKCFILCWWWRWHDMFCFVYMSTRPHGQFSWMQYLRMLQDNLMRKLNLYSKAQLNYDTIIFLS